MMSSVYGIFFNEWLTNIRCIHAQTQNIDSPENRTSPTCEGILISVCDAVETNIPSDRSAVYHLRTQEPSVCHTVHSQLEICL